MKDNTPIKIIAIVLVPLLVAVVIRLTISNTQDVSVSKSAKGDQAAKNGFEHKKIKIISEWLLPKELKEVSGISWMAGDRFACVQDEIGKIFIYNTHSASVESEIPFAGKGDYEGIAVVGEDIYVLHANGNVFEISNYQSPKRQVKMYETHLSNKQDNESLTYDKKNNRLLVAVKDAKSGKADFKGIYSFDLKTKNMAEKPVYKIDLNHKVSKGSQPKAKSIQPSDIEVHPITGDLYIIEGTKPKLMVLNAKGDILFFKELKDKVFSQPEGLSFSPDGQMYISNEGKPGNIVQVELVNN